MTELVFLRTPVWEWEQLVRSTLPLLLPLHPTHHAPTVSSDVPLNKHLVNAVCPQNRVTAGFGGAAAKPCLEIERDEIRFWHIHIHTPFRCNFTGHRDEEDRNQKVNGSGQCVFDILTVRTDWCRPWQRKKVTLTWLPWRQCLSAPDCYWTILLSITPGIHSIHVHPTNFTSPSAHIQNRPYIL